MSDTPNSIADTSLTIVCLHQPREPHARQLAEQLQLPLLHALPGSGLALCLTEQRIELRQLDKGAPGPVFVDFAGGKAAHRRKFGGGSGQPLARAIGVKKLDRPSLIDATAGLGRDAFVLATLGCRVRLIERNPLIATLLGDGLQRAADEPEVAEIASRMRLLNADAASWLRQLPESERPQVIYLDPMYPHRGKSALVKKEMRLFRQLVGDDIDAADLLDAARNAASQRVVVKRPAGAPWLGERRPSGEISSPNTRYDLYLC